MKPNHSQWIVVADAHRGRLIRVRLGPEGRWNAEEVEGIREVWEEKEHHRPSPLGPNKANHSYTSPHHEAEERLRRFARMLTDWVRKSMEKYGIAELIVCAPPRLMGAVREMWPHALRAHMHEIELELAGLPLPRLPEHPAIRPIFEEVWASTTGRANATFTAP